MRNVLLSLLLINALAWAYQHWVIEPDAPVAAGYIKQDYPRLSQVRRAAAVPAGPAREAQAEREQVVICRQIGPIVGENDAISIARTLQGRGLAVRREARPGDIWVGHWVQVVGLESRQAAEAARDRLVAAGLSDAYIVAGADELKVSLGVFKSAASADSTLASARRLNFTTRMVERYQPGVQHWLTVELVGGRELQAGELRSGSGQILRTEVVPCPPPGT